MLFFVCFSILSFVSGGISNDVKTTAKPLKCGLNEVAVKSRTICPPQNCEIAYTDYKCDEYKNIREPGCDCLPNYLRNGSGICIPNDDCPYPTSPICGINEIARDCRKICPTQTCQGRLALQRCQSEIPCEPGCDCVPNYLRNSQGVCVSVDKCDSSEPEHPTCSVSDKCIRTCASPNPPDCPYEPAKTNKDGCKCIEGYILSEIGGKCIKIEDCPSNVTCNGDPNAIAKRCPLPCPSTCDSPNATPCRRACEPIGCECKPGYLFSKIGGKCILPHECPGGNPCPENSEFRQCKYNCPQDYCPVDENTYDIVCDPWPTCLSGCVCKLNHRKLSYEDDRCVVASDCPPVNCTRPNEVWAGCPSDCFSGYCADREYQDAPCYTFVLNCQPKCVCERDTFRNASGICVPASECPPLCSVPDECQRTCFSPDPPNCIHEP
ncbi:unnamed protein product [Arctia plantaginis]|uniref:TIL domain-containing protein n=1 Tax=Arctia plantaginis TaxID=874455 RepID=A0A8S0ZNL9_ARCPL|nr:unnamed protein product [Arctia plantaginis]